MNLVFDAAAERELREAFLFYLELSTELGQQFDIEIRALLQRVKSHPMTFPKFSGYRKAVMARFPYCLFFKIESERILILAVAHQRRRPRYWRTRV